MPPRASAKARSKRNPSTWHSVTKYRSESMIRRRTEGLTGFERVPRPRDVEVVLLVARDEPVVGGVVDALEGERRAEVIPLGGVVVDDVEDHLEPRAVERLDEALELAHLLAARAGGRVSRVRREEPDRRVAPVVRETRARRGSARRRCGGRGAARRRSRRGRGGSEIAASEASPAYVPRRSSRTPGSRFVNPFTWSS